MKWIEITGAFISPNPVSCGAAALIGVEVTEKERFLTVSEVAALTVAGLQTQRVDLFRFNEE